MYKIIHINGSIKDFLIYIHCSAGLGRTGTFIALLWINLEFLLYKEKLDHIYNIYELVKDLRLQRNGAILKKEQYLSIFLLLHKLLKISNYPEDRQISRKNKRKIEEKYI